MFEIIKSLNGSLVNTDNSHTTGIPFSSNINPRTIGNPNALPAASNNIMAAAGKIPCAMKGGKISRRKINNISNMYKNMHKSRRHRSRKTFSRKRKGTRHRRGNRRHKKSQRGGTYAQYGSNIPNTPSYATGSLKLGASDSALANPSPYTINPGCTNCKDNYNHYEDPATNYIFKGWF